MKGFYQGFTATAARDAPYAGLYLVFYEKSKELAGMCPSSALCHLGSSVDNGTQGNYQGYLMRPYIPAQVN